MAKYVVTIESPGAELSADEIEARLVAAIPKTNVKKNDKIHITVSISKSQFDWGTIGQAGGAGIQTHHHMMPEEPAWFTEAADKDPELDEDVAFEDDDFEEEDKMLAFEDDDEGFEGENATALDVNPEEVAIAPEPNYGDGQNTHAAIDWWENL